MRTSLREEGKGQADKDGSHAFLKVVERLEKKDLLR